MPDPKRKKFWEFKITSPYGANDTDLRAGPHKGVDFGIPTNTEITPRVGGYVALTKTGDPELGNYIVVVDQDGVTHTYGHLSSISVKKGQQVGEDTVIGKSGATGKVTGPHLHYAIADADGSSVDPTPLFPTRQGGGTSSSSSSIFGGNADPNAPPATEDEGGSDWFSTFARSLGYLYRKPQAEPGLSSISGPGVQSQGLFSRPPVSGSTGQELFSKAPKFQGTVSPTEAAQLLPALDSSFGGTSAFAENVMRGLGFNPDIGNPFVSYMQKRAEQLTIPTIFARLMRNESLDNRAIADDVTQALNEGRTSPLSSEDIRRGFASIPKDPLERTRQQELLAGILTKQPELIKRLIIDTSDVPPDLAGIMPTILEQRHRAFLRRSADVPQESLVNFLTGGQ